jgi:hypothetical protein
MSRVTLGQQLLMMHQKYLNRVNIMCVRRLPQFRMLHHFLAILYWATDPTHKYDAMFRQFFSLGALSALLAVAATDSAETYTEIIDGYKFISSGPKHLASKAEYEVATHKTAVELLKERLGEDGLAALLQPDVNGSEPIWNAVFAANSTATPDGWLMTEGDVQAVAALPDLNGTVVRCFLSRCIGLH